MRQDHAAAEDRHRHPILLVQLLQLHLGRPLCAAVPVSACTPSSKSDPSSLTCSDMSGTQAAARRSQGGAELPCRHLSRTLLRM